MSYRGSPTPPERVASVTPLLPERHGSWVATGEGTSSCNLSISDLAERLESESLLRTHRSDLANLDFAAADRG